ncbi:hypothetical protein Peur_064569 [Populus x canadensis]
MEQLRRLSAIQKVNIAYVLFKCFPLNFFPNLKRLEMKECPNVESLRAQEEPVECSHLDQLPLEDCFGLKSVHCFLPCMAKLQIAFCDELESFPGVGLPAFPLAGLSFKLESLMI